jgi:type I restriction enzyme S subunit
MRKVQLFEICDISSGGTPSRSNPEFFNGDIPWAKISDIENAENGVIYATEEHISTDGLKNIRGKLFQKGTLLFAMYGSIGKVAITGGVLSTNQAILGIKPKSDEQVNLNYLKCWFESNKQSLINQGRGVALKNLSATIVRNLAIELPPLDDQIRIAHLLGKVEGLIAQRKQHLQQLDELLKSVFLEMFGDPVRNEKGWDIQPCEKAVSDISSGTSYGGEDRAFVSSDEVGVLKISAVTKGTFDPTEFKVVNQAQITKTLRFVKRGDFLFSRANTVALVAACCVVQQDYPRLFLPDKLWVLTLNAQLVNSQFFNYLLKNERYRDVVRSLASGGHDSMLNISMKKFMTLGIPCPPIDLQNQFAVIVEKVEAIKSSYQQSLADLENLYGALSQKAFKGELDLSRVPLPDDQPSIAQDLAHSPTPEASLAPQPQNTPSVLLDVADIAALATTSGRQAAFGQWLKTYLNQMGNNASFSLEHFMVVVNDKLQALEPEQESEIPPLGIADYDQIKERLFTALAEGKLTQKFDDKQNSLTLAKNLSGQGRFS